MRTPSTVSQRRGFSLAEVLISSMLVGVVLVGALQVLGGAIQTRKRTAAQLDGPRLAMELWSEIMSKPYEDPELPEGTLGPEAGETSSRLNFDDVDDFHGWFRSPPEDISGAPLTEYQGWIREVSVTWTSRDRGDDVASSETGLKRFVVRVTAPDGKIYEHRGLRFVTGALEQPPAVDATTVTDVTTELQIGGQTSPQTLKINLVNHADK